MQPPGIPSDMSLYAVHTASSFVPMPLKARAASEMDKRTQKSTRQRVASGPKLAVVVVPRLKGNGLTEFQRQTNDRPMLVARAK